MPTPGTRPRIAPTSVVVQAAEQISSDLRGEAVVLHLQSGRYYGLQHVAACIWGLVRTPSRVADIVDAIVREYDVEREQCERDTIQFLLDIAAQGLIEVQDGVDR
jgi:hypothetical protein